MEPIELTFTSQGVKIPGLDDALGKLERMDALLGVFARRSVTIDLKLNGAGNLMASVDAMKELVALLNAAGSGKQAALLSAGHLDPSEIARGTQARIAATKAELAQIEQAITEHHRRIAQLQNQFQFGSKEYNVREAVSRDKITSYTGRQSELTTTISLLERARGMADALRGMQIGEGLAHGVSAVAGAEAKLETQALDTTAAMSAQMAVAERKAKMMQELAGAVERTAAADRQQSAAARENAQANAGLGGGAGGRMAQPGISPQGSFIRQRSGYRLNPQTGMMELDSQRTTFREASGREMTRDLAGNITERSFSGMARERELLAAALAEYKQKRTGAKTDMARAALEAEAAGNLRLMEAKLPEGLRGTKFARDLLGRAGTFETRANDWRLRGQQPSEMDLLFQKQMHLSNQRDAAAQAAEAAAQAEAARIAQHNARLHSEFHAFGKGGIMGTPEVSLGADGGRTVRTKAIVDTGGIFSRAHESATHIEHFDAAGNQLASTLERTNNALSRTGRGVTDIGATFAHNIASVTMWSAAVGTLYAALGAVKSGFMGAIHLDREMSLLTGVLGGDAAQSRSLTGNVIGLSAREGRTVEEGMEAAIKFAHLPHARGQIAQFTDLAMQMANISGLAGGESGHAVASISEAFGFDAAHSKVAMNALNALANRSNTTVGGLMETGGRTGAIAKATGFGFTEYMSLLAGGAGATGRPVSESAQAMGMALTNLSDPEKAKELKIRYGVEIYHPSGVAKTGPEMTQTIQERYREMSPDAGLSMLSFISGGRRNAQRLAASFNEYDESIVKSVEAQRELNSAGEANNRILDTTQAKLNEVAGAWKNLFFNAHQGGIKSVTNHLLGGTASLLGQMDGGIGLAHAFIQDVFDPGGRSHIEEFKKGDQTEKYFQRQDQSIASYREKMAAGESLANADFTAARMMAEFSGRKNLNAEDIKHAARAFGGKPQEIKEHTEEWKEMQGWNNGDVSLADVMTEKANELRDRAKKRLELSDRQAKKLEEYLGKQITDLETALRPQRNMVPGFVGLLGGGMRPANQQELDAINIRYSNLTAARDENNFKRRTINDAMADLPEPATQATMNMREGVRYTLAGQGWLGGVLGSNSDPRAQMGRARMELRWRDDLEASLLMQASRKDASSQIGSMEKLALQQKASDIRYASAEQRGMLDAREKFIPGALAEADMQRRLGAYGVGLNPTQRIRDELGGMQGLEGRVRGMPQGIERDGAAGALLNEAYRERNALLEREFSLSKEIRQTEMERAREASRNLLMAGPEGQLAAAALQRSFLKNGQMDDATFASLDPRTKQQIVDTVPGLLPPAYHDKAGDLRREEADRAQNGAGIEQGLSGLIGNLEHLLQDRAGPAPQVGDVNVDMNFGPQFQQFVSGITPMLAAMVGGRLEQMQADFAAMMAAMQAGQGPGADAVMNAQ